MVRPGGVLEVGQLVGLVGGLHMSGSRMEVVEVQTEVLRLSPLNHTHVL